jgi:hypothetical protein
VAKLQNQIAVFGNATVELVNDLLENLLFRCELSR